MLPVWLLLVATKPEGNEIRKHRISTKNIILSQLGMGWKNAERKFQEMIADPKRVPEMVIHFGLAGGLKKDLSVGHVIFPQKILAKGCEELFQSKEIFERGKKLLHHLQIPFHDGPLYTSSRVLETSLDKESLGIQTGAVAVDMETYPIARACAERKIPYLALRAIFDPLEWDLVLPDSSESFDDQGNVNYSGLALNLLKKPQALMHLPKYQSAMTRANKALTPFLLAAMEEW